MIQFLFTTFSSVLSLSSAPRRVRSIVCHEGEHKLNATFLSTERDKSESLKLGEETSSRLTLDGIERPSKPKREKKNDMYLHL